MFPASVAVMMWRVQKDATLGCQLAASTAAASTALLTPPSQQHYSSPSLRPLPSGTPNRCSHYHQGQRGFRRRCGSHLAPPPRLRGGWQEKQGKRNKSCLAGQLGAVGVEGRDRSRSAPPGCSSSSSSTTQGQRVSATHPLQTGGGCRCQPGSPQRRQGCPRRQRGCLQASRAAA